MPEVYPADYPVPLLSPYSWEVDMGVLRTPMDGGLSRQRRLYDVMPHAWQLEYAVPMSLLYSWQMWVNKFGYDYFEAQLTSYLSSQAGYQTTLHIIRFTNNLAMDLQSPGMVRVRVACELSPAQVSNYNPPPQDLWIIGGGPAAPAPEEVDAGTPAAPSPDTIVGGTPANPSL